MNVRDKLLSSIKPFDLKPVVLEKSGVTIYVKPVSYALNNMTNMLLHDPLIKRTDSIPEVEKLHFLKRVCNEDGSAMFSESDWNQLCESDGDLIKEIFVAIASTNDAASPGVKEAGKDSGQTKKSARSSASR
ncbi:MAG: hypothetical protein ACRDAM_06060 [Casimicrobium sp.]